MPKASPRFRIPLRVQGIFYNSLPLIAVLLSAGFAFFSNQRRERTEMSLNRHFEMVDNVIGIDNLLLSASAGVRGHLLTHDAAFLESLQQAQQLVPQKISRVRTLMESIPKEHRRIERLAQWDNIQDQVTNALESIATLSKADARLPNGSTPSDDEISAQVLRNQPALTTAGKQLNDFRADEQQLLSKRIDETRVARQRDYSLIFLSLLVGLLSRAVALYFFHRRVIRRVRQLTENVRNIRDGAAPLHQPSGHSDEIGELERELARVSEFLAERRIGS
jgi:CHASE3 domain sensor protein